MPKKEVKKNNTSNIKKKAKVLTTSKKKKILKSTAKETGSIKKRTSKVVTKKQEKIKTFEELLHSRTSNTNLKKNIRGELLRIKRGNNTPKIYTSPYAYFYADFVQGSKYQKLLRSIENRLTDLDISGRTHKLSQFKNLEEIIEEDVRRGITTIVIIGDDKLLMDAINASADLDVVVGVIPVGNDNKIASMMGVPGPIEACDILSQRILENIDMGKVNDKKFFSNIEIVDQKNPLSCDNQYEILSPGGSISIYNINVLNNPEIPKIDPRDGYFEILVTPKQSFTSIFKKNKEKNESVFFGKNISISSDSSITIFIDGKKNILKNIEIEIIPKSLKLIVGKERTI